MLGLKRLPTRELVLWVLGSVVGLALAILFAMPAQAATLDAEEQAFVTLINNYRQQNGLVALKISDNIQTAAEWMSLDMGQKNYFSHTDSLGRDPFQRMSAFGYTYSTYKGENIAAGNSDAAATFTQWKNSSGHNANMLNKNFRVMGIGRAYVAGSTYRYYWTNDFGGYDDSGSTADTTAPAVSLTAPANGATVSGTVTVQATASDNVGVNRVVLTVDGGSAQTDSASPYSFTVNTTTLTNGTHTLTATAYDAAGNTRAAGITVTVNNAPTADTTPPTVSITTPATGATVSGRVRIGVNAADNVGVKVVAFVVDGGARIYDGYAPYEYYLDTAAMAAGTHTVEVIAWDAATNLARAQINLTVAPRDSVVPTVSITNPANGATVSGYGYLPIRVTATDDVAVRKVVFQLDGGTAITDGVAPWELWLNLSSLTTGAHTIAATAYDAAGNSARAEVTFTVAR